MFRQLSDSFDKKSSFSDEIELTGVQAQLKPTGDVTGWRRDRRQFAARDLACGYAREESTRSGLRPGEQRRHKAKDQAGMSPARPSSKSVKKRSSFGKAV